MLFVKNLSAANSTPQINLYLTYANDIIYSRLPIRAWQKEGSTFVLRVWSIKLTRRLALSGRLLHIAIAEDAAASV